MPVHDGFQGGDARVRDKLNGLSDSANRGQNVFGDQKFINVSRSPGGWCISLNIDQVLSRVARKPLEVIPAMIVSNETLNGKIRFTYKIILGHYDMSQDTENGGTWVADENGTEYTAFNRAEDMNTFDDTGQIGTGNSNVSQSDGTIDGTDCAIIPLPNGPCDVYLRGFDSRDKENIVPYYTIINFPNSSQTPDDSSSSAGGASSLTIP